MLSSVNEQDINPDSDRILNNPENISFSIFVTFVQSMSVFNQVTHL